MVKLSAEMVSGEWPVFFLKGDLWDIAAGGHGGCRKSGSLFSSHLSKIKKLILLTYNENL